MPPRVDTSLGHCFSLAGPIFFANLAIILSGTIDTIMAGRLSSANMAGVALGMAITGFVNVTFSEVFQGLSPIAGYYFGAQKFGLVCDSLLQALFIGLCFSIPGCFLLICGSLWTDLADIEETTAVITQHYLSWSAIALPGIMFNYSFMSVNAATGRPRISMFITIVLLLLKIPLNGYFMYGWFGFTSFGSEGAAISTAILTWLGFLFYICFWFLDSFFDQIRAECSLKFSWKLIRDILKVGVPIGIAGFCEMGAFSAMTICLARLGAPVVAAHQIVANVAYILYVIPLSLGSAGTVIISQCLGAELKNEARKTVYKILISSIIITICIAFTIYLYREAIISIFTINTEIFSIALNVFWLLPLYHIADALQITASGLLRGYKMTILPMLIYILMLGFVALGVGTLLCYTDTLTKPMGLAGYWIGSTLGLFCCAIIFVVLCHRVSRN